MDVVVQSCDLADDYVQFVAQIGADGFDIGPRNPELVPGVVEQGYADERGMRALIDRLGRRGLRLYRVTTMPPVRYLLDLPGADEEVDNLCRTVEALGRAGIPFTSVTMDYIHPLPNATEDVVLPYRFRDGVHRGGYTMPAVDVAELGRDHVPSPPPVEVEAYFERCVRLYERLMPIAEEYDIRLILHPSDPPLPDTPFSPRRWSRILDSVPSSHNGLLYDTGVRFETGVDVESDIAAYGRRGKIFHVHFRNVRGSIPTDGGYEEVALDDGDMNMFRILRALDLAGYDGALQVDHLPRFVGDSDQYQWRATAYAVGYIRALFAALEVEREGPRR
jgi:mannonate dehydratase